MIDHFNPTIKTFSFMATSIILGFFSNWHLNSIFCLFGLLCLITSKRVSWKILGIALLPITILAISFFVSGWKFYAESIADHSAVVIDGVLSPAFENGLVLGSRLYAYGLIGLAYSLTNDSLELVTSFMQQCHISVKLAYGVLAALHLLPTLKHDYEVTKLSYQIRGIKVSPFSSKPLFTLLVRTINWSDCLAKAMEAKGISELRTQYLVMKVHFMDILVGVGLPVIALALGLIKI